MLYIKHLLVLLFVVVPLLLLAPFITAIALCFTKPEDNQLPRFARWFDNHDHEGDGLNGYYKWKIDHPNYTSRYVRWLWLLRNPINTFGYEVLGRQYPSDYRRQEVRRYQTKLDTTITKIGNNDRAGLRYTELYDQSENIIWELYYVHSYGNGNCMRIRIGWKIGEPLETAPGEHMQWCFVVSPYVAFRGVE